IVRNAPGLTTPCGLRLARNSVQVIISPDKRNPQGKRVNRKVGPALPAGQARDPESPSTGPQHTGRDVAGLPSTRVVVDARNESYSGLRWLGGRPKLTLTRRASEGNAPEPERTRRVSMVPDPARCVQSQGKPL